MKGRRLRVKVKPRSTSRLSSALLERLVKNELEIS